MRKILKILAEIYLFFRCKLIHPRKNDGAFLVHGVLPLIDPSSPLFWWVSSFLLLFSLPLLVLFFFRKIYLFLREKLKLISLQGYYLHSFHSHSFYLFLFWLFPWFLLFLLWLSRWPSLFQGWNIYNFFGSLHSYFLSLSPLSLFFLPPIFLLLLGLFTSLFSLYTRDISEPRKILAHSFHIYFLLHPWVEEIEGKFQRFRFFLNEHAQARGEENSPPFRSYFFRLVNLSSRDLPYFFSFFVFLLGLDLFYHGGSLHWIPFFLWFLWPYFLFLRYLRFLQILWDEHISQGDYLYGGTPRYPSYYSFYHRICRRRGYPDPFPDRIIPPRRDREKEPHGEGDFFSRGPLRGWSNHRLGYFQVYGRRWTHSLVSLDNLRPHLRLLFLYSLPNSSLAEKLSLFSLYPTDESLISYLESKNVLEKTPWSLVRGLFPIPPPFLRLPRFSPEERISFSSLLDLENHWALGKLFAAREIPFTLSMPLKNEFKKISLLSSPQGEPDHLFFQGEIFRAALDTKRKFSGALVSPSFEGGHFLRNVDEDSWLLALRHYISAVQESPFPHSSRRIVLSMIKSLEGGDKEAALDFWLEGLNGGHWSTHLAPPLALPKMIQEENFLPQFQEIFNSSPQNFLKWAHHLSLWEKKGFWQSPPPGSVMPRDLLRWANSQGFQPPFSRGSASLAYKISLADLENFIHHLPF